MTAGARRTPAAVVVLRQLQVESLTVHPDGDMADTTPGVEPYGERPEGAVVRGQRARRESHCCPEELAALVDHRRLMIWCPAPFA